MTPFDPRLPIIASAAKVKTCHVFHCWHALKEMGKHFHAGAFATFAGLNETHVAAILSALEEHNAVPAGRVASSRGVRLQADFRVPQDWLDWAIADRMWTPADTQAEAEIFCDFWHAKSGAGAAKLDWKKTWQVWVRNSRRPKGDYRPPREAPPSREYLERTAAFYDRIGRHTEAAEIRRNLTSTNNVIVLHRQDAGPPVRASG